MPGPKRNHRERTDEWASIKQWTLWPEQELYEEIDVPRRTLARKADEFERYGMQSLFSSGEQGGARESSKTLPPEIRQLIVDLHFEHPAMSWREIAEICYIRYGRRPDHKNAKRIATSGPPPSLRARRYQPWHLIGDPAERKLTVIWLHSEGWSITSIAEYMQTSRPTIYDTLTRWHDEGVVGLDARPKTNKGARKATLKVRNEIRKLQENSLLGEYRVHTALKREGIDVSPATCGRITAANRQVYGLEKPKREPRAKRSTRSRSKSKLALPVNPKIKRLMTLIGALPLLPRQRQFAHDEQRLAALFNRFERLQTVRAALDVLIFGMTLWALGSYIS